MLLRPRTRVLRFPVVTITDRQGMAASGAQTTWQRRANCCFVQEDARSAPRFSSYPSSSSSKAESENIKPDCMPYNPSPELAPNTRWWLNLEPNCGPQEEFTYEQLKVLDAELELLNSGFVHKTPIIRDYYQCNGVLSTQNDIKNSANSFVEQPHEVSSTEALD